MLLHDQLIKKSIVRFRNVYGHCRSSLYPNCWGLADTFTIRDENFCHGPGQKRTILDLIFQSGVFHYWSKENPSQI